MSNILKNIILRIEIKKLKSFFLFYVNIINQQILTTKILKNEFG